MTKMIDSQKNGKCLTYIDTFFPLIDTV